MSVGRFFDRGGQEIDGERLTSLCRDDSYVQVACNCFQGGSVVVITRWTGQDDSGHLPPAIFETRVLGDGDVCVRSESEEEALEVHGVVAGRYREQQAIGSSSPLAEGAL